MVLRGAPPGNGETGAEDRIETPVSLVELEMRIVTAVRRYRAEAEEHFSFGPYRLDIHKRRLFCEKTEVGITRSEYLLLRTLAMNRGNIVSRRQLMQAVWGTATMIHGALDALVNAVRIKLKDEKPGLISAVAGVGYALLENAEAMKLAGSAGKSRNTPRKVSAEQKEDAPTA
jgi:DNA-binding response OmpR family regulator